VLRAAVMFTAFIIAETYERNSNIFNTMSASALLLLCINPYIIMEVGFQLSYLAVIGIVVLQKRIVNLWQVHNKWLQKLWQLTAVSLAAQLVTFPLGMLYFHQFPNYFLVSNLIVIPLSTIILYVSLLFFALCWWQPVAQVLANLSAWLTKAMNAVVLWFDQLPFSLIKGISLSVLESYLLFGIVCFFCSWFFWKRPRSLIYALVAGLALSISQVVEKTSIVQFTELCIHHIPEHTCITYCKGEKGYIFYDHALVENESRVRFHLNNYWNHLGIKEFTYIPIDSLQPFYNSDVHFNYPYILAGDNTIALANEQFLTQEASPNADYILFEKSAAKVFLEEKDIARLYDKTIFLSEKISRKKRTFLDEQLATKAALYDLKNGAYIVRKNEVQPFSKVY
jgi:competence protein ComEC